MIAPLVYIAGYGRSGSTLLEQMLARKLGGLALGEVSRYFRVAQDPGAACSCGASVADCPVWGAVSRALGTDGAPVTAAELTALERTRRSVEASPLRRGSHAAPGAEGAERVYAEAMKTVFSAAAGAAAAAGGAPVGFLVDSSKTAYGTVRRPQALARLTGLDVWVLHLVRDIRGVVVSLRRGLNRKLEQELPATTRLPGLRAVMGWVAANRAAERCSDALGADRYRLLRYEDLAANPDDALASLSGFLPGGAGTPERPEAVHQVAGNRARIGDLSRVKPDLAWQREMPAWEQSLLDAVLRPWMGRYGY